MNNISDNNIFLEKENHIYRLKDNRDFQFKSVTTFIGDFFDEFDAEKIATKLVKSNIKYMHLTAEELIEQWSKKAEYGTLVHEELENFIQHFNKAQPTIKVTAEYNFETKSSFIAKSWIKYFARRESKYLRI